MSYHGPTLPAPPARARSTAGPFPSYRHHPDWASYPAAGVSPALCLAFDGWGPARPAELAPGNRHLRRLCVGSVEP